jgi:hypothetical protein
MRLPAPFAVEPNLLRLLSLVSLTKAGLLLLEGLSRTAPVLPCCLSASSSLLACHTCSHSVSPL